MKTFYERWWLTRQLYIYINRYEGGGHRKIKIANGVDQMPFIQYIHMRWLGMTDITEVDGNLVPVVSLKRKIVGFFFRIIPFLLTPRYKKSATIYVDTANVIDHCVEKGYIKRLNPRLVPDELNNDGKLKVGVKGMEIYHWYYPAQAFFNLWLPHAIIQKSIEWGMPLLLIYLFARLLGIHFQITQ